jgi:hypothetical protein
MDFGLIFVTIFILRIIDISSLIYCFALGLVYISSIKLAQCCKNFNQKLYSDLILVTKFWLNFISLIFMSLFLDNLIYYMFSGVFEYIIYVLEMTIYIIFCSNFLEFHKSVYDELVLDESYIINDPTNITCLSDDIINIFTKNQIIFKYICVNLNIKFLESLINSINTIYLFLLNLKLWNPRDFLEKIKTYKFLSHKLD